MTGSVYTREFYDRWRGGASRSASIIVPIVLEFVPAKSVIDVGCGVGSWLSEFRRYGVIDDVGVDGDYVERSLLQIPKDRFVPADLCAPLSLGRTFDLAVSLEVAEHLPDAAAETFIGSLTALAPVVLFSAAIPFQDGKHHVNEQWPDYWVPLFKRRGYLPIDCIRRRIWQNEQVEWWYAQNILLFGQASRIDEYPGLRQALERTEPQLLNLVHPRKYLQVATPPSWGVRGASGLLVQAVKNAVVKRMCRLVGRDGG